MKALFRDKTSLGSIFQLRAHLWFFYTKEMFQYYLCSHFGQHSRGAPSSSVLGTSSKLGDGPNTLSESTVLNTELSEFWGPRRVLGERSVKSSSQPRVENSVSSLFPKQYSRNCIPPVSFRHEVVARPCFLFRAVNAFQFSEPSFPSLGHWACSASLCHTCKHSVLPPKRIA